MPKISSTTMPFQRGHDKRKVHYSNFMITFPTNVRVSDEDAEELAPKFYEVAHRMFDDEENLKRYVTFPKGGQWDDESIISVRNVYKVEVGHDKKGSRLHLHVGVSIKHNSFIQLDPDLLYFDINSEFENDGIWTPIQYVNIKVKPPSIEDYLDK